MNELTPPGGPDLAALARALPDGVLLTDPDAMAAYGRDWSGDHRTRPLAVARPRSAAELSALMRHCYAARLPVVPQGGLTGLVGAAVPADGRELVVSLERMDRIRAIDPIDFAMVVEAGCVLETAKAAAEEADCILPLTFGAQGSCRIGGNVSTNAGGFNVLRYGMTRDLVLGLEVVLSDGRIWNGLKTLRKDNTGYDLKQLFIGAEGTLGIVTAAALKLFPRPSHVETALIGLGSVEDAMALYARARRSCSDLLVAFELILREALEITLAARSDFPDPIATVCPVYVLIEVAAGGSLDLRTLIENLLIGSDDLVRDGVVASSREQGRKLWQYREIMVEVQGGGEPYFRTDVSLPISKMPVFVAEMLAETGKSLPEGKIVTYGHVGDGNLHVNFIPPRGLERAPRAALFARAEQAIFSVLDRHGGSISAEHGIGRVKQSAFLARADPVKLALSAMLKDALDPRHILSNGRILPPR